MEKIKGICFFALTFFSFFGVVVFTPALVYEVFQTAESKSVEAEVIESYFGYEDLFGREACSLEVELNILSTNENVIVRNAKPGDIAICSSKKKFAANYQPGDFTIVFLSKNGEYYLALGSYLEAMTPGILSIVWFVFFYSYIKIYRKRASQVSPN
ncbi:hypothetical protein ACROAE_09670 [Shewanella sp. MF05960]|uniref:hypothetical protein n=1 Tax=Shewanella sp. MF05960 TaxID=3434874 RepID=UPI003D7B36D4